jgi:hypothetical protein
MTGVTEPAAMHGDIRIFYLASTYAGFGGYTGVIQSAGVCADMILREG